ncbi:MAG TPA: DNA-directed RNA polymerase subunit alpha C-terminal domain-containing protein [Candidatus Absconditabacterales bacterium]|nr:DNA-directed RNA polymerase subunit alpha C-terminal domain-containing protein [Candidatus Absconditabacterales bacterium]
MLDLQKIIGTPAVSIELIDKTTNKFTIKNLPRGFGYTFGNSIRRLVLGYSFSGAITGIKVKNAPHEYTVLEGVKESVLDILMNLKGLRFKVDSDGDGITWVAQKFNHIGHVTSDQLKLPHGIELITPHVYLFEITEPSTEVYIEYRIEKGYGYITIQNLRDRERKLEATDTNLLLIDNSFSVVNYIKYHVEEVATDFTGGIKDTLIIEIQTISEAISPKDILKFAGKILGDYASLFMFDNAFLDESFFATYDDLKSSESELQSSTVGMNVKKQPIEILGLSERTRNALLKNNIMFVEELEMKKKNELINMRGVGRKAVDEIEDSLKGHGKKLGS